MVLRARCGSVTNAALPQHSAVRLCLAVRTLFLPRRGSASPSIFLETRNGKPQAFRSVRRLSRSAMIAPATCPLLTAYRLLLYPVLRRHKRLLVINQHNRSEWHRLVHLDGCRVGNANAAVALRRIRNGRVSMNRQSIAEIVWIVEQTERRLPPSRNLGIDSEAAPRCVRQSAHAFFVVVLVAAG